jgi:hypothetical protein
MAVQNDRPALVLVQVEKIASAFNFADGPGHLGAVKRP